MTAKRKWGTPQAVVPAPRALLALLVALTALAFGTGTAGAEGIPPLLTKFGENCGNEAKLIAGECAAAGETVKPSGVATDPVTGHIFVTNGKLNRIEEFTPWGEFVKAFGWDVAPGAVEEEQEVRVRAGSGQFRLTFESQTTASLPFDATAAEVESALNGLAAIGSGGVSVSEVVGNVSGTTPYIYVLRFEGASVQGDIEQLGIADGGIPLAGGQPATEREVRTRADGTSGGTGLEACTEASHCKAGTAGGGGGQFDFSRLLFEVQSAETQGVAVDSAGNIYVSELKNHRVQKFDSGGRFLLAWGGDVVASGPDNSANDEEQEVAVAATSGTFTLSFTDPFGGGNNSTTAALPFNASAAEVETALNGLATIAGHAGSVSVSGGPGDSTGSSPYKVTFDGGLAGDDVPQLTIDRSGLGPASIGARLYCSTTVEAATYEYAWLRNGEPIVGATSSTYVTTAADEGKAIQCQVFAKNANGGTRQIANPAYVAPPAPGISPPVAPSAQIELEVTGSRIVGGPGGATAECRKGTWTAAASFSYRWYRNGVLIPGANSENYVLTAGDLATPAAFQCVVLGTNAGGTTAKASKFEQAQTSPPPDPPFPSAEPNPSMEPVMTTNQGGGAEVCKPAAGDQCKAGNVGSAPGQFGRWANGNGRQLAISPTGAVYVGDAGRVQVFNQGGGFEDQVPVPGEIVRSLAVDPAGNLYVAYERRTRSSEFAGDGGAKPTVHKLNSAGVEIGSLPVNGPESVASDSAGNVYVVEGRIQEGSATLPFNEILEFDSTGNSVIPAGSAFARAPLSTPQQHLTGLAVNRSGDIVSAAIEHSGQSFIAVYGPPPVDFESPPPAAPVIVSQFAISVGGTSAKVGGEINPKFWPDTKYYVQYGTAPCELGGCAEQPLPPGLPLTSASINAPVDTQGIDLTGLSPGTTYHYRFVAGSSGGGPTIGSERTFTTHDPTSELPDGRVYELTSPSNKEGGEVGVPTAAGGGAQLSVQPQLASISGDRASYASFTAFGESPASAPISSQYISSSLGGGHWETDNPNPRFEEGFTRDPFVGFSPDLSHAAMIVIEPLLTPDATAGFANLYVRDNLTGAVTAVTTNDHKPELAVPFSEYCFAFAGASSDYSRVFFTAKGALLPGDPKANGFNLYEWSAAGLNLVSVLPDSSKAVPNIETNFGIAAEPDFHDCNPKAQTLRHAISADGSHAIWTYGGSFEGAQRTLMDRVGGSTLRLDKPQGVTGKGGSAKYWDASVDGSKVFFTEPNKLTTQPTKAGGEFSDLYRYDFAKPEGQRLENLTPHTPEPASVVGVLGSSADGSYVYFVAKGSLASGATSGANNLYVWHEGAGLRFVASLGGSEAESKAWTQKLDEQRARVSPDGSAVTFLSTKQLTGFDNAEIDAEGHPTGRNAAELFLYDYATDSLSCPSCNPFDARPRGPAALPPWSTPYQQARYLSQDGGRLFFATQDALNSSDINGRQDIYEFERAGVGSCAESSPTFSTAQEGCVFLISTGRNSDDSYFIDASESGGDVFFSTRESLVYPDGDNRYDVYDARVGGTLVQPPQEGPCGKDESCPGPGTEAPASTPAGTRNFSGPADPVPTRSCPKGTRKVKKKGKVRCVKTKKGKKHKKHANGRHGKVKKGGSR